jgi:hypothetical protein
MNADNQQDLSSPAPAAAHGSSPWLFVKTLVGVAVGFGVLVVLASPQIYIPSMRDTPQSCFKRAQDHVEKKEFDAAIEDYQRVLEFEAPRKSVFVKAERKIKDLQQLKEAQQEGGAPMGSGTSSAAEAESGAAEPAEEEPDTEEESSPLDNLTVD